MKDSQKKKVLEITKQESLAFVMPGIAADAEGHVISEDGLIALVEAIETGEAASAALATAQAELSTANTALTTAQEAATTAQTALTTAQADLEKANAKIAVLEKKDGGSFSAAGGDKPDTEGKVHNTEFLTSADAELAALTKK